MIVFDNVNQQFLGAETKNSESILLSTFDAQGKSLKSVDISSLVSTSGAQSKAREAKQDAGVQHHELVRVPDSQKENMSILKFDQAPPQESKGPAVSISDCGFQVSVVKRTGKDSKKKTEKQLVLTNMAFSTGVHAWEIICPISCQDVYVGAYNPLTKTTVMESFYNTSPRSIFVCLDLNKHVIKFWLNEHNLPHKSINILEKAGKKSAGPGQQWIPAIKIGREGNQAILNPFPYAPLDFSDDLSDRHFDKLKMLLPHLASTVCVSKFPKDFGGKLDDVLQLLKIKKEQVASITIHGSGADCTCFIEFNSFESMYEFTEYHKQDIQSTTNDIAKQSEELDQIDSAADADKKKDASADDSCLTILLPSGIFQMIKHLDENKLGEAFEKLKAPLTSFKNGISLPKESSFEDAKGSVESAYKNVVSQAPKKASSQAPSSDFKLHSSTFTDKVVCVKDSRQLKAIHRGQFSEEVQFDHLASFSKPPLSIDSKIQLRMPSSHVPSFFQFMQWQSILKENQSQSHFLGIITSIFSDISASSEVLTSQAGDLVQFSVTLFEIKLFLEIALKHLQMALKRQSRDLQNQAGAMKNRQQEHAQNKLSFQPEKVPSIEDLQIAESILHDLSEQLWASTLSTQCPQPVKSFMSSVSRPHSALCRLGTFSWFKLSAQPSGCHLSDLADLGLIYKQSNQLCHSQAGNSKALLQALNYDSITDKQSREQLFGGHNRMMNGLLTANVELRKSLGYMPAHDSGNVNDVILSQNSEFALVAKEGGKLEIHSTAIGLTKVAELSLFSKSDDGSAAFTQFVEQIKQLNQEHDDTIKTFKVNQHKTAEVSVLKKTIQSDLKKTGGQGEQEKGKNEKSSKGAETTEKDVTTADASGAKIGINALLGEEEDDEVKIQESNKKEEEVEKEKKEEAAEMKHEIIGHFMLTEPAHKRVLDPITVGCVYKDLAKDKVFARVKKLAYNPSFLRKFLYVDAETGLFCNKFTDSQVTNGLLDKTQNIVDVFNQLLTQHHDQIVDLYALFKKGDEYAESEAIFEEMSLSEVEIADCTKVVDITTCSFSISQQNKIHVLLETSDAGKVVRQFSLQDEKEQQESSSYIPQIGLLESTLDIKVPQGREYQQIHQFDDKVILVASDGAKIFDQSSGTESKDVAFPDAADLNCLSVINKSPKKALYCLQNMTSKSQQLWSLVYKSKDQVVSHDLVVAEESQKEESKMQQGNVLELTQQELTDVQKSMTPVDLSFKAKSLSGCQSHLQGFGANREHHSLTVMPSESKGMDDISVQVAVDGGELGSISPSQLQITQYLKVTDAEKALKLLSGADKKVPAEDEVLVHLDKNSKQLPLILEQYKGAQTNETHKPSVLTTGDSQIFCSNYPEPEYIFRHQHGLRFMLHGFTVKSQYNRQGWGIPIGRGYIFASENLEDIGAATKRFMNRLKLYQKEWEPKDTYVPNEPVGRFEMSKDMQITVELEPRYQRAYRFVKLVPFEFRRAPINYSRIKFNSKPAEMSYFGIHGQELDEEDRLIPITSSDSNVLQESQFASLRIGEKVIEKYDSSLDSVSICVGSTQVEREVQKVLKKENIAQYQPIIKMPISFDLPESGQVFDLVISQKKLSDYGLELSSTTLEVRGMKKSEILSNLTKDADSAFNNCFTPIVNEITSEKVEVFHIQLLKSLLACWKVTNKPMYTAFIAKIDVATIESLLKNSLKLHQIEQIELMSLFEALINNETKEKFVKPIEKFVKESLDNLTKVKWRESSIAFLLCLSKTYLTEKEQQRNILEMMIKIVTADICNKELLADDKKYKSHRLVQKIEPHLQDVLDGELAFGDIKKLHRNDIVLDMGNSGNSMLSKSQLTELYKFNNVMHYNLDFQGAFRVNKLKLFLLNQNDFQKLQNFKIRVIVSVPEAAFGEAKPHSKVIYNQLFDENQIYQLNKQPAGSSKDSSFQHKLTIDLDKGDWKRNQAGVLTRYMSVQVQLLPMKGFKEQAQHSLDFMIFPQAYGLTTSETVAEEKALNITAPSGENLLAMVSFDEQQNLIYNIGEVNDVLQLDNSYKKLFDCRSAVFALRDETKLLETQDQFDRTQSDLAALRKQIEKKIQQDHEADFLRELIGGFKIVKQNFSCYFAMSTNVTYDYLYQLRETLCQQIYNHIKVHGMKTEDQSQFKELFYALINCMILEQPSKSDDKEEEPVQTAFEQLMEFILSNIEDHYQFYCELLNKYVIESSSESKDSSSKAFTANKFLLSKAQSDLNQVLQLYEQQFDCVLKEDKSDVPLLKVYEMLQPKSVTRNKKQKLQLILQVIFLINQIIKQSEKIGMRTTFEVDSSHMFNLLAQHLIYCPKIKFEALSPSQGSTHKNSIQITSQIVLNGLDALVLFIKSSNVTSKFDLKKSKFELTTLMLAILLLEDQKTRQKAIQTFMKIAEMDHDGVIIGIIDEYMQGQKEIYKTRNQNSMVRDVIDLIGIQLEQAKKLLIRIESLKQDPEAMAKSKEQHTLTITSIEKIVKNLLGGMHSDEEQGSSSTSILKDQWLKFFEIVAQTSFLTQGQAGGQEGQQFENLIKKFHTQFLNFSTGKSLSAQEKIYRQSVQLSVYPNFIQHLHKELSSAKRGAQGDLKPKVIKVILEILDTLVNFSDQEFEQIQFEYAYGIVQLLQSDGEKVSDTLLPSVNFYQLEDVNLKKEKERLKKVQSIIKVKMTRENLQKLMDIFSRFLESKLVQTNRFYDKANSMISMQKLTVANQMIATIEWAEMQEDKKSSSQGEKLTLTAYQKLIMNEEQSQKFLEDNIGCLLDWALNYRENNDTLNQNKLVQEQARKLHCNMLSLLMKASPQDSVYNLDDVKPEGRIRCLDIYIKALLERVEKIEQNTIQQLKHQRISYSQVLKNQENSNKTLMFFFKKWIVNDQIASSFLRKHNGLNFMLSRLLIKKNQEETQSQITEVTQAAEKTAASDDVSSDECNPSEYVEAQTSNKANQSIWNKGDADLGTNTGTDKISDAQYKNFTTTLKEQELSSIIDLVYTDDKRTLKANCSGYGGSLKISFSRSAMISKEYHMVFQIKGIPSAQLGKINFAVTYQFSNSQLNMRDIPLFVMAEGGMKHDNGTLSDVQWTVPLSFKPQDQQLLNYFGSNIQCYAFDFDQMGQPSQGGKDDGQIDSSSGSKKEANSFVNKAKFIKITVRHPQIALKEIQQMYNFSSSQMNYAYQFLSCLGCATAEPKQVMDMLTQCKKDSSMEMLSQFFQGEFSETFKSISSDPEIIAQFKILFGMLAELLEDKEDLIKPIFLSMCQDNDELCTWVIENQILNDDFDKVTRQQIVVLGELIKTQKQPESFIKKLTMLRNYLFKAVRQFGEKNMHTANMEVVPKMFGILVGCIREFENLFPQVDKEQEIEFSEQDLLDLVKFQATNLPFFVADDINRPVTKLLAILLQCPKPFKNSSKFTIDQAASLLLSKQVEEMVKANESATEDELKAKLYKLPCIEMLTTFASYSENVYKLIQKVKVKEHTLDVIQIVIDKLLKMEPTTAATEAENKEKKADAEKKEGDEKKTEEDKEITFAAMFDEPDTEQQDLEKMAKHQSKMNFRDQSASLVNHLYKLSNSTLFYSEYGKDLARGLYTQTLRQKDKDGVKTRTSDDLSSESVELLIKIMSQLIMRSKQENSASLHDTLSLLKEDLTDASNLDPDFIKDVVVPLLHAEEKSFFRLNFKVSPEKVEKEGDASQQPAADFRMPIFWSKQGQTSEQGADSSEKKGINVKKYSKRPFFLNTDLLTDKMKENFEKAFVDYRKDMMPEVTDMVKSEWQLLYKQTKEEKGNAGNSHSKQYWLNNGFKEMVEQCQDKTNFFILCKGRQTVTTSGFNFQGEEVTIGCYSHNTFPQNVTNNWKPYSNYQIQHSPNNIFFVYSNSKMMHFEPRKPNSNPVGYLYTDGTNGGALIIHNNFLAISWSQDYRHMFGDINYITQLESQKDSLRSQDFEPLEVQLWHYVPGIKLKQKQNLRKMYKMMPTFQRDLPHNYFSSNLIFEECHTKKMGLLLDEYLDSKEYKIVNQETADKDGKDENGKSKLNQLSFSEFKAALVEKGQTGQIIDIDVEAIQEKPEEDKEKDKGKKDDKKDAKKEKEEEEYAHKPFFPILNKLEQDGGIVDLINVAIAVVNSYHSEKSRGTWSLWLEEIKSFIELPNFFTYFSQDYQKSQTVYKLIARNYDIDKSVKKEQVDILNKKYEKMYSEHVNYIYKIINEVFSKHTDSNLRSKCIQNGTYSKFLDRLGQLTGEKKRTRVSDSLMVPEKDEDQNDSQSAKSNSAQKAKETGSKKKKGVGYGGGSTTWNVAEYLQSKEAKNDQIAMIVSIIMQSIKEKPEEDEEEKDQIDTGSKKIDMKDIILESALLPILESAMRSGSLLEMAKQAQLYNVYLDLIVEMAQNKKYIILLDKISREFVPEQKNSIQNLLEKVAGQSQIFVNALSDKGQVSSSGKESEDDKKSRALAERIIKTEEIVKSKMKETLRKEHSLKLQSLASLPLNHAFTELLAPLRFAYMSMKKSIGDKNYDHVHNNDVQANPNPSQSKIIRLAQEIADLSNSLPCEPSNAMFCRVEKGRVDLMKIMIMGASGTPYAHGAFVYDLFFPDTYPNNAPKCLLVTTGGGQVRFNPNLYNQGKVCLSLLGTWGGSNTETWDPKLSTILQLVMSIQAIIMSNEVYFNEPGYEHEMSTPAGEKKNTGYSNIVKYCNVKFAIIEAIKSPPKGFEKVIRRNFFLKKQMILDEVKEWCIQAKDEANAVYSGLVSSHNSTWATKLSQPGAYKKMMDEVYKELEKTLNSIKNPFDDDEEDVHEDVKKAIEKVNAEADSKKLMGKLQVKGENLEDIDVSYKQPKEKPGDDQKIDIQDDKVKDRWSRYIGAMGIEAVAKQAESRVLICDMGALSVEIAKNIVLAGCKELVIFEKAQPQGLTVTANIASGQFFLSDQDKEQSLALQSKHKLQELNHYVKVTVVKDKKYGSVVDYLKAQKAEKAEPFRAVVHTEFYTQDQEHLIQEVIESNKFCHAENIPFIWSYVAGCTARIFTDFGAQFKVLETSSEEIPEVMIQSIEKVEPKEGAPADEKKKVLITLIDGAVHQFQEGDRLKLEEVNGMKSIGAAKPSDDGQIDSSSKKEDKKDSINGLELVVLNVLNKQKFEIELDMDAYTKYEGSGIAKYQKTPKIIEFKSLEEYMNSYKKLISQYKEKGAESLSMDKILEAQGEAGFFDQNLIFADFENLQEIQLTDFLITGQIDSQPKDDEDEGAPKGEEEHALEKIYSILLSKETDSKAKKKLANTIFKILFMHNEYLNVNLAPLCAFLGGVIAQEIVKAMTQKFLPVKQVAYVTCSELIEDATFEDSELNDQILQKITEKIEERTQTVEDDDIQEKQKCQIRLLGKDMHEKIKNCKLFMIGAGAIGCELLKNYAMLGVGTGENGHIILTDPDVIEVSNLNRQFLFREQHLRKPKSSTAAAAAIQMNKSLKGHILARLDKIHDETADIYSEEFYESQTIVTNALDNVKARLYIDGKCVQARVPMIDSGTLGPKGHVQVVIPFKTESYASQKDPEQSNEIPYCTLKMFPEETLHCVEWAKDLFDNWFTLDSQSFNKFLIADLDQQDFGNSQTKEIAKKFIKMDKKRPQNFKECIHKARKKFQSLYVNNILQLLHTYPLDKKNADGRPFWSLPKRPPKSIDFDPENEVHSTFVGAYACLLAGIYKIDFSKETDYLDADKNPRSKESRKKMATYAAGLEVKPFVPNDEKAKQIQAEVDKATGQQETEEQEKPEGSSLAQDDQQEVEEIQKQIQDVRQRLFGSKKDKVDDETQKKAQLKVEEFEKDEDENFHIDIIYSMANIRAANYSLQYMDWITVKIKAGRIVPALATTTAAIAGLQTIEMLKIIKGIELEKQKNSFLNLAVPSLMMGEPGAPEKFKLTDELSVNLWDRWEFEKATPKTTLLDVIQHIDKIHKSKLEFRDVFQGAKPLFIYSLGLTNMKLQKLSKIEECAELNKSILELTGTSPKEMETQKFIDLTITFIVKKDDKENADAVNYEILKNVPDIRVYFGEEKASTASAPPLDDYDEEQDGAGANLFGDDDDY